MLKLKSLSPGLFAIATLILTACSLSPTKEEQRAAVGAPRPGGNLKN